MISLLIDGTYRTDMLHSDSSLSFSTARGSRGSATLTLVVRAGETPYIPPLNSIVKILDDSTIVFAGVVQLPHINWISNEGDYLITITCPSLEAIFDNITVTADYGAGTPGSILSSVFATYCSGHGVTLGTVQDGSSIDAQTYNASRASEIFSSLASHAGFVWFIDPTTSELFFGLMHTATASVAIHGSDMLWESIVLEQRPADGSNGALVRTGGSADVVGYLKFTTDTPGLSTSFLMSVSMQSHPVGSAALIDGNWIVQSINGKWIPDRPHFRYDVSAIDHEDAQTVQQFLDNLANVAPIQTVGEPSSTPGASGDWVQEWATRAVVRNGADLTIDGSDNTKVSSASAPFADTDVGSYVRFSLYSTTPVGEFIFGQWSVPAVLQITGVAAGVATMSGAVGPVGTGFGIFQTLDAKAYWLTWAPKTSSYTGNQIVILDKNGSQLTPFLGEGYDTSVGGIDYTLDGNTIILTADPGATPVMMAEYFPDGPAAIPRVVVSPPAVTACGEGCALSPADSVQFVATVTGMAGGVTWSLIVVAAPYGTSSSMIGTLSSTGLYTCPNAQGGGDGYTETALIACATSTADPTKKAYATIQLDYRPLGS